MNKVITISREYGAGGHAIGKRVAEELGIEIYDRDIVRETVKASGFETEVVEQEAEEVSKTSYFLKSLVGGSVHYHDPQDAIHDVQRAVILNFAQQGPCVILGRCADDTLQKAGVDCLNVFIHADDVSRAMRVSEMTGSKNAAAANEMSKPSHAGIW